jgi:hypothetical protein
LTWLNATQEEAELINSQNKERLMDQRIYKKMAGTSAAVVPADLSGPSPIERDGLAWTELSMPSSRQVLKWKPPIDSALALEELEDYKPPAAGDARYVANLMR